MNQIKRQEIDLNSYTRKGMFDIFTQKTIPFISTTSIVDITQFRKKVKDKHLRFFACISYVLSKVVNEIPQFRHRIVDGKLYEYAHVDPGYTILLPDNEFSFCSSKFTTDFDIYYRQMLNDMNEVMSAKNDSDGDNNHQFYITSIPWFVFTSFTHPYDPVNGTIPIVTLGKYFEENGVVKMPVAIQVHHGVMDGYHTGLFYQKFQYLLDNCDWL